MFLVIFSQCFSQKVLKLGQGVLAAMLLLICIINKYRFLNKAS